LHTILQRHPRKGDEQLGQNSDASPLTWRAEVGGLVSSPSLAAVLDLAVESCAPMASLSEITL